MASKFQAPAILTRISYLKDGGLSLGFATQELTDADKVIASKFYGKFGHVLFAEDELTEADIPKANAADRGKSPSQRLRAVLYIRWTQLGQDGDFEVFYRQEIEKVITRVKTLLD